MERTERLEYSQGIFFNAKLSLKDLFYCYLNAKGRAPGLELSEREEGWRLNLLF